MPAERLILCGSPVPQAGDGARDLRLKIGPGCIHFRIEDIHQKMVRDIPRVFLDLLEIAAYVYVADQAVARAKGGRVDVRNEQEDLGEGWRRQFRFRVAVREPEIWATPEVSQTLAETLGFLSDDTYAFEFEKARQAPPMQQYFDFGRGPAGDPIDDVMLFSGGLDSLGGAVQESLVNRRRMMLVHHRSTEKLTPRHMALVRELRQLAGRSAPMHVPVRVNKKKSLTKETTQRSRSFLCAALGATLATMLETYRLRFYENGVVSLNLPVSSQLVGARATRTTHPRVLQGFARLFSLLGQRPFTVENTFVWKTKTEVLEGIRDAGAAGLIVNSFSCAHTRQSSNEHTHCGECSQCIDRRFAVLAAKLEAHDPGQNYKVDLLRGPRCSDRARLMLAAYLETVNEIERLNPIGFFQRYGEVSRAVRHVTESPDTAAMKIFDLYSRHAKQVTGVVDRAIAGCASEIRLRTLPPDCLISLVTDVGEHGSAVGASSEVGTGDPQINVFRKEGEAWRVTFQGDSKICLPSRGLDYLHMLVSAPGVPHTAAELRARFSRSGTLYPVKQRQDQFDLDTLANMEMRLREIRVEIEQAKKKHDEAEQSHLEKELEDILNYLQSSRSINGKIRQMKDEYERLRKSVGNAIRRAIDTIKDIHPAFAAHLRASHVVMEGTLCYSPRSEVVWSC